MKILALIVALVFGAACTSTTPPRSFVAATRPAAPHALAMHDLIRLTWTPAPSSTPITRYEVWKSLTRNSERLYAVLPGNVLAWADHNCNIPRCYYRVRARNAAGAGPFGPEVSASPL